MCRALNNETPMGSVGLNDQERQKERKTKKK